MTRRSLGSRKLSEITQATIRCVANDSPAGMFYTTAPLPGTAIIVEFHSERMLGCGLRMRHDLP